MTLRTAIDISNHNGPISARQAAALYAAGGAVSVQAVDPPPPYPRSQTRQQLSRLRDAGYAPPLVDAYVWWFPLESTLDGLRSRLALLDGFGLEEVWLDVEDTAAGQLSLNERISRVGAALDAISTHGYRPGIYTARWFWLPYMQNRDAFSNYPLWSVGSKGSAGYGEPPETLDLPLPYGGWTRAEGIQYTSSGYVGDFGPVDMSVWEDGGMTDGEIRTLIDAAIKAQVLDPLADWQRRDDERHAGLQRLLEAHLRTHGGDAPGPPIDPTPWNPYDDPLPG